MISLTSREGTISFVWKGDDDGNKQRESFEARQKITDRIPQKLGISPLTEADPEFWGLAQVLDDDIVEVALAMKLRTPYSLPS